MKFKDPWRDGALPEPSPTDVPTETRSVKLNERVDVSPIRDDIQNERHSTLHLKGYGGITIDGLADTRMAAGHLLNFCVDHIDDLELTLLHYGVVVSKFEPGSLTTPFFIQRADGWTIAIPNVPDRDTGFLQLIQALLDLWDQPKVRTLLKKAQIRPYKM